MGYTSVIKTSILFFPVIAMFMTIPYMIWMYRKYGSIHWAKTLIVYSFILYLESSFLLVNLPLPQPGSVHNHYIDMINLIPFQFIGDFISKNPFHFLEPATYLRALKHGTFYVPAFNILMLVPFGIYLRYYFNFGFKKTILFSALLSLFFELTQLSGLFFMYDSPYRFCDIDDIIQNTLGGVCGYFLAGMLGKVLPSREVLDAIALEHGEQVPGLRKLFAFIIDISVIRVISRIIGISYAFEVVFILYFLMIPWKSGKTIGSRFFRFHFMMKDKTIWKLFFRSVGMLIYFYGVPNILRYIMGRMNGNVDMLIVSVIFLILFMILITYFVMIALAILTNKTLSFDRMTDVTYVSDIENKYKK